MLAAHPLYLADRTAGIAFAALYAIWIGGEIIVFVRSLFRAGAQRRDRGSFALVFLAIFVTFALGSLIASRAPWTSVENGRAAVFYVGLAVMAVGIVLRFTAVIVLGRFFTFVVMVGSDQHVVQTGPYRWIRHPSYTGSLLIVAGLLLAMTNWLSLLAILPVLAALLYRMNVEERALLEQLGEPYRSYMGRTKRLIPFVY